MQVVVHTGEVPPAYQLARYREVVRALPVPLEIGADPTADFLVRMSSETFGEMAVARISSAAPTSYQIKRTRELIRRSDPEAYRLVLTRRGRMSLSHAGRSALIGPRDLALYDTSLPFEGRRGSRAGIDESVMVTFPRALLPLPARVVRQILGARLPGQGGIGALVYDVITRVADDMAGYRAADATRVSDAMLSLTAAMIARHLDEEAALAPEVRQEALFARVKEFIRRNLGDPQLSPAAIAAAHYISPRSLHRLFHAHGITVAQWIHDCRLEQCRRDLADAQLRTRPIHAIAARWGFTDAAHFSRAFRAAYEISPREARAGQGSDLPPASGARGQVE